MSTLRTVTINLEEETAALIEREVAGGRAETVQAYVKTAVERTIVLDLFDEPDHDSPEFQAFLAECEETARRIDEGLEPTYTLDEVRQHLAERRAARQSDTTLQAAE